MLFFLNRAPIKKMALSTSVKYIFSEVDILKIIEYLPVCFESQVSSSIIDIVHRVADLIVLMCCLDSILLICFYTEETVGLSPSWQK